MIKKTLKTPKKKEKDLRDSYGRFAANNKAAEKWTKAYTMQLLNSIWAVLTEGIDECKGNPVLANKIKTLQEVCLMHNLDPDTWAYIKTKHIKNAAVMRLIKKILWVLEARLLYSAGTMDIFILKNHYHYADKKEVAVDGHMNNNVIIGYGKEED